MTYTHPYTHPFPRVPLHAAFAPTRSAVIHAQQTYTQTYTTYTRQAPTRPGGSLYKTPGLCAGVSVGA